MKATSRKVLSWFIPLHDLLNHSIAWWHTRSDGDIVITCSCDSKWRIDAEVCKAWKTTMAAVREGLSNAPMGTG